MPHATVPRDSLVDALDRLARLPASPHPMISLYLNLTPDGGAKPSYEPFVRKELADRIRSIPESSPVRERIDRDVDRIRQYLANGLPASAKALAIFACDGRDGLFETLPLDVSVDRHRLAISPSPHLYPLALLLDQHPRHAAVLADSHMARIFVFDPGRVVATHTVEGEKVHRSSGGGWAQMRYQRHVDKLQAEHARELVGVLERVVRDDRVEHVLLSGDEVNVPLVKAELSKELAAKVIDVIKLEAHAPQHAVMKAAEDALRRYDARSDEEAVTHLLEEYRAGGLAEAGERRTMRALADGRVDELFLTVAGANGRDTSAIDELVTRALQTSARVRFIEDATLLDDVGGVAARLRYRLPVEPHATADGDGSQQAT